MRPDIFGVTCLVEGTTRTSQDLHEELWARRECILAEAEERQTCPLCRAGITAEALREGVMPRDDEVIGQAGQESGAQEEAPGPSTQGHPGAHKQQLILFESKLNVLLNEVSPVGKLCPALFTSRLDGLSLSTDHNHSCVSAASCRQTCLALSSQVSTALSYLVCVHTLQRTPS